MYVRIEELLSLSSPIEPPKSCDASHVETEEGTGKATGTFVPSSVQDEITLALRDGQIHLQNRIRELEAQLASPTPQASSEIRERLRDIQARLREGHKGNTEVEQYYKADVQWLVDRLARK